MSLKTLYLPVCLVAASVAAFAQGSLLVQPQVRVVDKVVDAQRVRITGTHPAVADRAVLGSRLGPNKSFEHLILVLRASDEQDSALRGFLDEQQDHKSPNFHKWLTPDQFRQQFGVASSDITKVTAWMQDSGLVVEKVSAGGRFIQFGGPVRTVEAAFQTEIHKVTVDGVEHISNTTDIAIPQALAPVVKGVARLNNFFPISNAKPAGTTTVRRVSSPAAAAGLAVSGSTTSRISSISQESSVSPDYGTATGTHYVTPGDVAVIYNSKPLLDAGIDGTGQSISVIARTNINLSDVASFRTLFGLSGKLPKVTVVGTDPGLNGDDGEAYLDAEWAGAVAPNADVNFIVSGTSLASDGIDNSALYAVDNNLGDIISLSYGGCESGNGASGTAFWNQLWQQAAAQGQTAMVSSGDSGAAGCDSSSATYATQGYGVNALGSSDYNVAVGGSMFVDFNPAQYWSATGGTAIPFANALSYVPEAPVNESRSTTTYLNRASTAYQTGSGIFSGGGGVSAYSPRPAWQTGSGIGADPVGMTAAVSDSTVTGLHRLVPDIVNIAASGHDATLYCASGLCSATATDGLNNAGLVGGTSVATPVWASAQALINQVNGGRQGNANYYYYKLADAQYSASTTACQAVLGTTSTSTPQLPAANCNFHDVVTGSIRVPTAASGTANIGFDAAVGFDEASGLGSANITNLANNWQSVNVNSTKTTLSLLPLRNFAHGTNKTATVQVTPTSGSGTPTGDVSLIVTASGSLGAPQVLTLSGGNATATINSLPGGTYAVYAHYSGDGTFTASDSLPVTVAVNKEDSLVELDNVQTTSGGAITQTTSFPYAAGQLSFNVFMTAKSGNGVPSGTINYTVQRNGAGFGSFQVALDTKGTAFIAFGPAIPSFYLTSTGAALPAGTYTVTAAYSGDASFNASTGTASFTVNPTTPSASVTAPASITSGQAATLTFKITTPATATPATGTVTFIDTTAGVTLGTATLKDGSTALTTNAITDGGAHSINANYSGDANYSNIILGQTVTVGGNSAPTVAVTASPNTVVGSAAGTSLRATLNPTTATGIVTFLEGTYVLGNANLSGGAATLAGVQLPAGLHTITASYQGSTTNAAATGTATITINMSTTTTTLSAPPAVAPWGQAYLSAIINRSSNITTAGAFPLSGRVNFSLTNTTTSVVTVVSTGAPIFEPAGYGYYVATVRLPESVMPGTYSVSAAYSGDSNFGSSTSPVVRNMTITKATPTLSVPSAAVVKGSSTVAVTALLSYPITTFPTGLVTLTVNGISAPATCTNTGSAQSCTANFLTSSFTGGTYVITANYAGDANYTAAATATGTLLVSPDLTGTILSLSQNNVPVGTAVTLNVLMKDRDNRQINPTGTVTFFDGQTQIGSAVVSNGASALSYTPQTAGNHTLSATFTPTNAATFTAGTSTTTPVLVVTPLNL